MFTIDSLEKRQLFAGGIDTSFGGGDGSVGIRTAFAPINRDAAADDKGRTVLASAYPSQQKITLTRLTADGTTDKRFGKNGFTTIATGFNKKARGPFQITVDHAGKILVMFKNRVTRVNESGGIDKKFGSAGGVNLPIFSDVGDLTVDAKNRPVIVGTSQGKTGTRATIVRLGPRGALDTSFGGNGAYKAPVPSHAETGKPGNGKGVAVKVLADGRIVGVGSRVTSRVYEDNSGHNGERGVSAFRLNFNGSLDGTYGDHGSTRVVSSYDEDNSGHSDFEAFYPDGGMIIGNSSVNFNADPYYESKGWTKLNANGHISAANFEGLSTDTDEPPLLNPYNTYVAAIGADNKPLLRTSQSPLYRYNPDFSLDDTFANPHLTDMTGDPVVLVGGRALMFGLISLAGEPVGTQLAVVAIKL